MTFFRFKKHGIYFIFFRRCKMCMEMNAAVMLDVWESPWIRYYYYLKGRAFVWKISAHLFHEHSHVNLMQMDSGDSACKIPA